MLSALAPSVAAPQVKRYGRPPAKFGKGDIGILNYALTLEYLESEFYNEAANAHCRSTLSSWPSCASSPRTSAPTCAYSRSALGGKAAKKPKFNFHGTNTNATKFLADLAGAGEHRC